MRKLISIFTFLFLIPFSSTLQSHPSSFADLVENLSPAVVSIASTTIVKDNNSQNQMPRFPEGSPFDDFFKEYFDYLNPKQTIGGRNQDTVVFAAVFALL